MMMLYLGGIRQKDLSDLQSNKDTVKRYPGTEERPY